MIRLYDIPDNTFESDEEEAEKQAEPENKHELVDWNKARLSEARDQPNKPSEHNSDKDLTWTLNYNECSNNQSYHLA